MRKKIAVGVGLVAVAALLLAIAWPSSLEGVR